MTDRIETMVVGELMTQWPDTVPVFIRHRMACPGCVMAPFMTVREAAHEYGLDPAALAGELAQAIGAGEMPGTAS
jgi:hybrid cluster-associated redox disulfide protein